MAAAQPSPENDQGDRSATWIALAIALAPIPIAMLITWALGPAKLAPLGQGPEPSIPTAPAGKDGGRGHHH